MTGRTKAILLSAALAASLIAGPQPCRAGGSASPTPAAAAAGTYDVKVAGWVKGAGHSTASGSTVSITATVEDEGGNHGDLSASGLTIDDKLHFRGSGTVLGQSMTISGRIDAPASGEKQLKTRRIVGTFVTEDGHYGRIAGFVPPADGSGGTGTGGTGGDDNGGSGGGGGGGGGTGVGGGGGTGDGGGNGNGGGNGKGNNGNGNGNGGSNGGGNGQGNNGNGNGNGGGNGQGNDGNGHGNGKGNNGNGLGNGGGNGSNGNGNGNGFRHPRH